MLVPEGAKAGRITKPYGLHGDVTVILEPGSGNLIRIDNPLFIEIDGQRVPFFVKAIDLVSETQAILKFEFIDDLEEAKKVTGCRIYLDPAQQPAFKKENQELSALIGFDAFDREAGLLGRITDYLAHDMNPVFIIDFHGNDLLVPATGSLIQDIDQKGRTVHFILPQGLTSL